MYHYFLFRMMFKEKLRKGYVFRSELLQLKDYDRSDKVANRLRSASYYKCRNKAPKQTVQSEH